MAFITASTPGPPDININVGCVQHSRHPRPQGTPTILMLPQIKPIGTLGEGRVRMRNMECKFSCDLHRRFQAARVAELGKGKSLHLEVFTDP